MAFEKQTRFALQTSLADIASCEGVGLHSGEMIALVIYPAPANFGIKFRRSDLVAELGAEAATIPARYDSVTETMLGTVIENAAGAKVSTVEHLMAALAGAGVDNALIDVSGPEVPVMDGSSQVFLDLIAATGLHMLDAPKQALRITREVIVEDGLKKVALKPHDGFSVSVEIEFDTPVIGHQSSTLTLMNGTFARELGSARTFGFLKDVEMMKQLGLGLGGSLDNAIVIDQDAVLNEDGLRFDDEFVRHKALDAVGDLALAGLPILGAFEGTRPGHEMNNRVLRALFADPANYEIVSLTEAQAQLLPSLA